MKCKAWWIAQIYTARRMEAICCVWYVMRRPPSRVCREPFDSPNRLSFPRNSCNSEKEWFWWSFAAFLSNIFAMQLFLIPRSTIKELLQVQSVRALFYDSIQSWVTAVNFDNLMPYRSRTKNWYWLVTIPQSIIPVEKHSCIDRDVGAQEVGGPKNSV